MRSIRIYDNGAFDEINISRKEIVERFKVHSRDLRPVFTKKLATTIVARGQCIIMCVRSVKIIIATDRVLIFNLDKKKIPEYFVPILNEKIQNWKSGEKIYFEHLILETALHYLFQKLNRRFEDIERTSEQLMNKLETTKIQDQTLEQLLHLKKRLSKLSTNITETEREITELVDDDEELIDLYLTKKEKNTDEIESLLENILEQIEDLSNRSQELEDNIDDTQEILTLKMNNLRNRIIKYDLMLTSAASFLTLLAVVTGAYGMNLKNHNESSPEAFLIVSICLVLIFIVGFGMTILWMRKKDMI